MKSHFKVSGQPSLTKSSSHPHWLTLIVILTFCNVVSAQWLSFSRTPSNGADKVWHPNMPAPQSPLGRALHARSSRTTGSGNPSSSTSTNEGPGPRSQRVLDHRSVNYNYNPPAMNPHYQSSQTRQRQGQPQSPPMGSSHQYQMNSAASGTNNGQSHHYKQSAMPTSGAMMDSNRQYKNYNSHSQHQQQNVASHNSNHGPTMPSSQRAPPAHSRSMQQTTVSQYSPYTQGQQQNPTAQNQYQHQQNSGSFMRTTSQNSPQSYRTINLNGSPNQHNQQQQMGHHQQQMGHHQQQMGHQQQQMSHQNQQSQQRDYHTGSYGNHHSSSSHSKPTQQQTQQNTYASRQLHVGQSITVSAGKDKSRTPTQTAPSKSEIHHHYPYVQRSGEREPEHRGEPTRRPVSQQAGHLHDSWPNSNTHHHLAPVMSTISPKAKTVKQPEGKSYFEQHSWGGTHVKISNKPVEINIPSRIPSHHASSSPSQMSPTTQSHRHHEVIQSQRHNEPGAVRGGDLQLQQWTSAQNRQLALQKEKSVTNTLNTLAKLSPKKPIVVFMRNEGLSAVKAGADAGEVIKKLAGSSKLPFYNGTSSLPPHNMPTVFLGPEDMSAPYGYGPIPIPNINKKPGEPPTTTTPAPTYTKILLPGGNSIQSKLQKAKPLEEHELPAPGNIPGPFSGVDNSAAASILQNQTSNVLSLEAKLRILQLIKNQAEKDMAANGQTFPTDLKIVQTSQSGAADQMNFMQDPYSMLKNVLPPGAVLESVVPMGQNQRDSVPAAAVNAYQQIQSNSLDSRNQHNGLGQNGQSAQQQQQYNQQQSQHQQYQPQAQGQTQQYGQTQTQSQQTFQHQQYQQQQQQQQQQQYQQQQQNQNVAPAANPSVPTAADQLKLPHPSDLNGQVTKAFGDTDFQKMISAIVDSVVPKHANMLQQQIENSASFKETLQVAQSQPPPTGPWNGPPGQPGQPPPTFANGPSNGPFHGISNGPFQGPSNGPLQGPPPQNEGSFQGPPPNQQGLPPTGPFNQHGPPPMPPQGMFVGGPSGPAPTSNIQKVPVMPIGLKRPPKPGPPRGPPPPPKTRNSLFSFLYPSSPKPPRMPQRPDHEYGPSSPRPTNGEDYSSQESKSQPQSTIIVQPGSKSGKDKTTIVINGSGNNLPQLKEILKAMNELNSEPEATTTTTTTPAPLPQWQRGPGLYNPSIRRPPGPPGPPIPPRGQPQFIIQQAISTPAPPMFSSTGRPPIFQSTPMAFVQSTPRPMMSSTVAPFLVSSTRSPHIVQQTQRPQLIQLASPAPSGSAPVQFIQATGMPPIMANPSGSPSPNILHNMAVQNVMRQQAMQSLGVVSSTPRPFIIQNAGSTAAPSRIIRPVAGQQIFIKQTLPSSTMSTPTFSVVPSIQTASSTVQNPILDASSPYKIVGSFELNNPLRGTLKPSTVAPPVTLVNLVGSLENHGRSTKRPSGSLEEGKTRYHSSQEVVYGSREEKSPATSIFSKIKPTADRQKSSEEKLIEKVITEEKIVWKEGPANSDGTPQLIPSKIRTEERIIMRPSGSNGKYDKVKTSSEIQSHEASRIRSTGSAQQSSTERLNPQLEEILKTIQQSAESYEKLGIRPSTPTKLIISSKSKEALKSNEVLDKLKPTENTFAGLLRTKMKFDKMREQIFTGHNTTASIFKYVTPSTSSIPTIASSIASTLSNIPTSSYSSPSAMPSFASSFSPSAASPSPSPSAMPSTAYSIFPQSSPTASMFSPTPVVDNGRFKIRPGDLSKSEDMILVSALAPSINPASSANSPYPSISSPTAGGMLMSPSVPYHSTAGPSVSPYAYQTSPAASVGPTASASMKDEKLLFIPTGMSNIANFLSTGPASLAGKEDLQRLSFLPSSTPSPVAGQQIVFSSVNSVPDLMAQISVTQDELKFIEDSKTKHPTTTQSPPVGYIPASQSTFFKPAPERRNDDSLPEVILSGTEEKPVTWRPSLSQQKPAASLQVTPTESARTKAGKIGADTLHAMTAEPTWSRQNEGNSKSNDVGAGVLYALANGGPNAKFPAYQVILGGAGSNAHPTIIATAASKLWPEGSTSGIGKLKYGSSYRIGPIIEQDDKKLIPIYIHKSGQGRKALLNRLRHGALNNGDEVGNLSVIRRKNAKKNHARDDVETDADDEVYMSKRKYLARRKHRPSRVDNEDREDNDTEEEEEHVLPRRRLQSGQRRRPIRFQKNSRHSRPTYRGPVEVDEDEETEEIERERKTLRKHKHDAEIDDVDYEDSEEYIKPPVFHAPRKNRVSSTIASVLVDREQGSPEDSADEDVIRQEKPNVYVNKEMFVLSGEDKDAERKSELISGEVKEPFQSKLPRIMSMTKEKSMETDEVVKKIGTTVSYDDAWAEASTPRSKIIVFPGGKKLSTTTTTAETETSSPSTTMTTTTTTPTTTTTTEAPTTSILTTKLALKTTTLAKTKPTKPTTTTMKIRPKPTTTKATTTTKKDASDFDLTSSEEAEYFGETQEELQQILKKIEEKLQSKDLLDELSSSDNLNYDDYYDEFAKILSTKATTTLKTPKPKKATTKGTTKSKKKSKKPKVKKNKTKGNVKSTATTKKPSKVTTTSKPKAKITQKTTTTTTTKKPVVVMNKLKHHRHPINSLEHFTSTSVVSSTSSTTKADESYESASEAASQPSLIDTLSPRGQPAYPHHPTPGLSNPASTGVAYVFPQNPDAIGNVTITEASQVPGNVQIKKRPLWVRRRDGMGGLQSTGVAPQGSERKVIRLVRRRRPVGLNGQPVAQHRRPVFIHSDEQNSNSLPTDVNAAASTMSAQPSMTMDQSTTVLPIENLFGGQNQEGQQQELFKRVGSATDSIEKQNAQQFPGQTMPTKRKVKLIRLKGQGQNPHQWRLRLNNDVDGLQQNNGPQASSLIAPKPGSSSLETNTGSVSNTAASLATAPVVPLSSVEVSKSGKSADAVPAASPIPPGATLVETKVCVRGKCQVVS